MEKEYEVLGALKIIFDIPCIHLTFFDLAEEVNDHGNLTFRAVVPESVTQDDVLRCEESMVTVCDSTGGLIFSGISTYLSLSHTAGYQELLVMAKTCSIKADQSRESGTFQSEGKMLAQVAQTVLEPCGISVTVAQDIALPQMLSRQNETAWEFVRRISNEQGLYVYPDGKAPHISIGLAPFSEFSYDSFQMQSEDKNIADFLSMQANMGSQVSAYQTAKETGVSSELSIGAGSCLGNGDNRNYAVVSSRILSEGDLLVNHLTLTDPAGAVPVAGNQTVLQSTVLTGTVMAVEGVNVLVQFSSDGPAAGTRWIPYESAISNYFYCMPNEGDQVFAYYQNDGTIVCLGSKWSGEMPDFENPKDRALVAWEHMIKASEKKLEFVLQRDYNNPDNEKKTHISFRQDEGLVINSENELYILAPQHTINLASRQKEWDGDDAAEKALTDNKDEAFEAGRLLHTNNGGGDVKPQYTDAEKSAAAREIYVNMIKREFFRNIIVSGVMDAGGRISSAFENTPDEEADQDTDQVSDEDTSGIINICATEYAELSVGDTFIKMNKAGTMGLSAQQYEMYGQERGNYERIELENYTKRDQALDMVQCALGVISIVAWLIPPPAGPIIAIAADVADAVISVNRGDMIGAGLACCGVIGDIGKAAKVMDAATTLGKAATKAASALQTVSKVTNAVEVAFGVVALGAIGYSMATTGWDIISEGMANGWTQESKDKLAAWATNLAKQAAQMLITTALKNYVAGVVDKRIGARGNNFDADDVNERGTKGDCKSKAGDPVDTITGSFYTAQTDFVLSDIHGEFRLMRRHESARMHEKQLLGTCWVSSIGLRLTVEGNHASMLKEDLYAEEFKRTEAGWVNCWGESHTYELHETGNGYLVNENTTGKTYCYNQEGFLTVIVNRYGNRTEITYCGTTVQRLTVASGQYLDFTYAAGKVAKITDCAGRSVRYDYEGEYLTAVTYPDGGMMNYKYDPHGLIVAVKDQNGVEYLANNYDEKGRVTKQDIANGEEHAFLYHEDNRQTTYINLQSGRRTVYHYNEDKLLTKIAYDDGTAEEYGYDQWGNRIFERNRNNGITRRLFRQDGKLLRSELPGGLIWEYEYDLSGNKTHWRNNGGQEFYAQYDARNNCIREEQIIDAGCSVVKTCRHDRFGRMTTMTDGNGNQTEYAYWEKSGKISDITTAEGACFRYTYNELAQCMSIQSDMGTARFGYTALGARALETDALGNTTRYRYDFLSNLIAQVLPNQYDPEKGENLCYRHEYDAMDHRVCSTDPSGNVYATPYDTAGRLAMEINPNTYDPNTKSGQGIRYEYDTDDRRIKVIYPDGGIRRLKYDSEGNLVKVIEPEQYDPATDDGVGYCYMYDLANHLIRVTNPEGTVEKCYTYDLLGRVVKEVSAKGYLAGDSDKARIGILYRYNAAGWLLEKREPVWQEEDEEIQYRLTCYSYDNNGNMLAEKRYLSFQSADSVEGSSHTISFIYDKQNRLIQVSDELGASMQYTYDSLNQCTSETRLLSEGLTQVIRSVYDAAGRLVEVSQTADEEGCGTGVSYTRYTYDGNGNLTGISLPAGGKVIREYDAANRLIAETHRDKAGGIENRTEFIYDKAGNLLEVTDNQGRKTYLAYDLLNREIRRIEKDGGIQRTIYDRDGKIRRLIRPNQYNPAVDAGLGFQYTYDLQGRITTVLGPDGMVLQTNTYDADGQLLQRLDGVGSGVQYEYDFTGARRRVETMGGAVQTYEYDACGNIIGIVDGNQNRTQYQLDKWGRIIGVMKADGSTEHYAYNFAGALTSSTDGEGNTTRYEYNRMGKIAAIVDAIGERETYHYDGQGRMVRKTDRNGVTVEYGYNLYDAPLYKREQEGTLGDFYEYTPEGLLKSAISGGMRYSYEYDAMNRMIRKSASGRTLLAMGYDKNGNKVRQNDATGKVTEYIYNPLDLLTGVRDDGNELASYEYNPDGTIRTWNHGSICQQFRYDIDKNLTALQVQSGNNLLVGNHYTYDGNGNRTQKRQLEGTTQYQYDPLNQIRKVEYPSYSEELYYDKSGNRTCRIAKGIEELYQYDPRNRLVSLTKGGVTTAFQYDCAGNLLKDGCAEYTYDAFNRTAKAETFNGNVQINRYDAEGLRAEIEENGKLVQFIFNQDKDVVLETGQGEVIRLIRATSLIARITDAVRMYYHYVSDEMGSTTHITDEVGKPFNQYSYDAWGNISQKTEEFSNRYTYYGQQLDPITQQYYLRARFYNPVIARFTQEDVYRGDGLNLYAYCQNNPVYYIDPSGYRSYKDGLDNAKRQEIKNKINSFDATETEAYRNSIFNNFKNGGAVSAEDLYALAYMTTGESVNHHIMIGMAEGIDANGNKVIVMGPTLYISGGTNYDPVLDPYGLSTHTEQKFIRAVNQEAIKSNMTVTNYQMTGFSDPCTPKCRPAIRDAAIRGITTTYNAIVDSHTWTFEPTQYTTNGGVTYSAVTQTMESVGSGAIDQWTYWRSSAFGAWKRRS